MTTSLFLIRHAKRAHLPKCSDRECPISDEGRLITETLAKNLTKVLASTPAAIYYSPTRRTQETAEIIAAAFQLVPQREQALFFGQEEELFQKLPDPELNEIVIFVGHGPSLELFGELATGKPLPISGAMPESSAILLHFPSKIGKGQAQFISIAQPSEQWT